MYPLLLLLIKMNAKVQVSALSWEHYIYCKRKKKSIFIEHKLSLMSTISSGIYIVLENRKFYWKIVINVSMYALILLENNIYYFLKFDLRINLIRKLILQPTEETFLTCFL